MIAQTLPDDPNYCFVPAYDVEHEVQQIRIVIEGMAGYPRFLDTKLDRPVIVTQPAGFQTGSAVVDIFVNLPTGAPSRGTCGKPLQPPTLAKSIEIDAERRIPAVRAISGAQAERQFLVPVWNTKRRRRSVVRLRASR